MSNRHAVKWRGKSNKHKTSCTLYASLNKRATNRIRRIKRHIKKLPNDLQAINILKQLKWNQ